MLELILASQSPRRAELLRQAGIPFRIEPASESAETPPQPGEAPRDLVRRLAFQKAKDVATRIPSGCILAADTVADCGGEVLGKPKDIDHARRMLIQLSGQPHEVHTGICLWLRPQDETIVEVESTTLVMDQLTDQQLERYLESGGWQGKAGAFGYQDGLDWVHIVNGSESNVVGLPMERLTTLLSQLSR